MTNTFEFLKKVNKNLVSKLDILNFIDEVTENKLSKLKQLSKDLETFEVDFICSELVESWFNDKVYNPKSISKSYDLFKKIVTSKIRNFKTETPTVPAPENEQNKMYFQVGLLFAKKEIYKNVVHIDGYNKVNYHFKDEVFDNPSQLSKRLLLTRQFINDSFTGAKTKHNIFNNLRQLKNIIDYCNKNEIVIDAEFLNKYTTLAESKQ